MLLSIAYVLMVGMAAGWLYRKLHLSSLTGMTPTGIVLRPYVLGLINGPILGISAEFREITLVIILMRAGLSLDVDDLKRIGCPTILICFVPACLEIVGTVALAPRLLGIFMLEAATMRSVVAAVSPAVVVPKMIRLMEEGHGTENSIPQPILAGAFVDDVFIIVLFSAFTGLAQGMQVSTASSVQIPLSILVSMLTGAAIGVLLAVYLEKVHIRDAVKVIILPRISLVLVSLEDSLKDVFSFSSLISVVCVGIVLQRKREPVAGHLSLKFNKLWVGTKILLFVLVGATMDMSYVVAAGGAAVLLILGMLALRMAGVVCCFVGTKLNLKERMFCMATYIPKATVQAAVGGMPPSTELACRNIVPTVAALAILIATSSGAFLVDLTYRRRLTREY